MGDLFKYSAIIILYYIILSLNNFLGLLGDGANLMELSNMLDGLSDSDDFLSKRRMDTGEEEDETEVKRPTSKAASTRKRPKSQSSLNNEVGEMSGLASLGDLTSLLEMLTSESKNKEIQVCENLAL